LSAPWRAASRGARLKRAVARGLGGRIVAAVVDLGVNLGLRWIAEGVRDARSALTSA
jgi:EAL domain-containing protein (putative c-di-GMP-specific phosphodiesterase class I)